MTQFYVKGATRMYKDHLVDAWIEAEENMGLKNCIYFWDNGTTTQWIDSDEAEMFFRKVKCMDFAEVFDKYFRALEDKDLVKIFECLSVFNEIDENQEIVDDVILRRLKRVRESTHEEIYNI